MTNKKTKNKYRCWDFFDILPDGFKIDKLVSPQMHKSIIITNEVNSICEDKNDLLKFTTNQEQTNSKQSNKMRKVRFNKWIPEVSVKNPDYTIINGLTYIPMKGTGCMEKDFPNEGVFLQWVNTYIEYGSGVGTGNYTVALVELSDGTVVEVAISDIKFIEPAKQND